MPENLKYKTILDNMLEGCQILDFQRRYLYINNSAEIQNRRPKEELIGNVYENMWPGIENTKVFSLIYDTLKNRNFNYIENKFTYPDGKIGWFEIRFSPIPEGVFIMSLDISKRKEIEAELKKAEEKSQQSQKLESIGQLAGGIAHDFNNMLTVIIGHSEMALYNLPDSNPLHEDLEEILKTAKRSAELTQQLLGFARKQNAIPKVINPNLEIENLIKFLKRVVGEDISIIWNPKEQINTIKIDPNQLNQILTNLCVNSRDAIKSIGEIEIATQNVTIDEAYCDQHPIFIPGEYVLLTVRDTGIGMNKKTLTKVFEPFFTTKGIGQGTGLGLATVYGIIKQNNGFIDVYSEVDTGTIFKIYLPAYGIEISHKSNSEVKNMISGNNETILLVEDDISIIKIAERILKELGYHVLKTHLPSEAIKIAKDYSDKIHLLITDVIMPEMTGPELEISISKIKPDIKTIFVSGYTASIIAKRGLITGNIKFLPKPFTKQEIGEKIKNVLGNDFQN